MQTINSTTKPLAFFISTLLLAGCGAGGSDSTDPADNSSSSSSSETTITAENAERLAAAAFSSVGTARGLPINFGSPIQGAKAAGKFAYSEFVTGQLTTLLNQNQLSTKELTTANKSLDCHLYISAEFAEDFELTVDDTIDLSLDNCTYDATQSLNGEIDSVITYVDGSLTGAMPYTLGLDSKITNLKADDNGIILTSNGDMSMLLSTTDSGESSSTLSGESLSVTFGDLGVSNTLYLTDYQIDITENDSGDYSVSQQGIIDMKIPFITLSTTFTTPVAFTGNHNTGTGNPTAGQLVITGERNTKAWITAQPDGEEILIEVDINGDGIKDGNGLSTTWDDMEELIGIVI